MSRFPHYAFRAAVVISLAGLAFHAAAVHAARKTSCCAYRSLIIVADLLEASPAAIWTLSLFALMGLSIIAVYPLVRIFVGIALSRREGIGSLIIDCVFGIGAITGLYFAWVVAMGHSEPNWAQGFRTTWLALVAISGVALFLTRNRSKKTALRVVVWIGGLLLAAAVPEDFREQHSTSTKYVFAVLITCTFWIVDVCLSRFPARQSSR